MSPRLFHVVDVRENLLLGVLVHFADQVYGVVGVHVVDKLLGDDFAGQLFQHLLAVVLVEFEQDVGGLLAVEQHVDVFGLVEVELLVEFGNVGGVQLFEQLAGLVFLVVLDDLLNVLYVFGRKLFHVSASLGLGPEQGEAADGIPAS